MKSLIVSVFFTAWIWTREPHKKFLCASYAEKLSKRDSIKCRQLIKSSWYQKYFGDVFQFAKDQNEKLRFDNNKSGFRIATSVDGVATGEGGDILICDDPNNMKEIHSQVKRENVLTWWDEVMTSRLNDKKTGARIIIQQRGHEQDLSGHVLAKGYYEHLCIPMEYEGDKNKTSIKYQDPRKKEGDLLWPSRFPHDVVIEMKKDMGSMASAGQLQQKPSPDEGVYIKKHWFKYFKELPPRFDEIIMSVDCTFKGEVQNDFVCIQIWGRVGANKYLLDEYKKKMDIVDTMKAIKMMSNKWPECLTKIVEEKANGAAVIRLLKDEIPGMIPYNPGRDGKVERVISIAPTIEAGNVYLPHSNICTWDIKQFVQNCGTFPNVKHDDDIDCMSQALIRLSMATPVEYREEEPTPDLTERDQW